ncbi:MAG: apolipoprotein N-acyltransferase [Candidatus Hatepunaea meridiana]|nr:apolipoprotein N-acyltransferase [Candidatus Hatepunaea meridiana]
MKRLLPPRSLQWAALSGLLLTLALPPLNEFILAWIGLIPLFAAIERSQGNGLIEGFTTGVIFNTGVLYWLAFNSGTHPVVASITMMGAVLYVSTGWAIASWLFFKIRRILGFRAWLLAPFAWTAWEGLLAYIGELAFPWSILALTQTRFSALLQVMEFTGVFGVSFWVVSVNVLLFVSVMRWRNELCQVATPDTTTEVLTLDTSTHWRWSVAGLVLIIAVPLLSQLNTVKFKNAKLPSARVMVVQGNIPPAEKWTKGAKFSWAIYDSLTRAGVLQYNNELNQFSKELPGKSGYSIKEYPGLPGHSILDLIVWPETAIPAHLMHQSVYADKLTELSDDLNCWILTGASDYCRTNYEGKPLNGAFLAGSGQGLVDRYAKVFLVPFGERVPFQWIIPQLGKLNLGQAEFLPGLKQTLFEVSQNESVFRFPAMICYEAIFPWISSDAVKRGADLLVTVSNDAWYGHSTEPEQIAALSRFRCIETRRSMVRASNNGISQLIDHLGREIEKTERFIPVCAISELPLCQVKTFYVTYGDLFLAVVTAVYGIFLVYAAIRK